MARANTLQKISVGVRYVSIVVVSGLAAVIVATLSRLIIKQSSSMVRAACTRDT